MQAGPARHDQAVTPTNEEVELESKATGSETNRILFDVSCGEEEEGMWLQNNEWCEPVRKALGARRR